MARFFTSDATTANPLPASPARAASMVAAGDADSFVAGAVYPTREVIIASLKIIGLRKNVFIPSSFFLMNIPNYSGGENGNLIFSDVGKH